jgi:CBS domain-containing protein
MSTTVRDVMTTHVVAVTKDASFKDVARDRLTYPEGSPSHV